MTAPERRFPELIDMADRAVMVRFADDVDPEAHARVLALDAALADAPFAGFVEAVPAFASLMACFDPLVTTHAEVRRALHAALTRPGAARAQGRVHEVAVCYAPRYAPDLAEVARQLGISEAEVIAAHLAGRYSVSMYGFAPGYGYLAGVPEAARLGRKPVPKRDVPAGSVLIAGAQCLVSTITMPTGWWIIGRSPTRVLTGDEAAPFLFDVGDEVRFTEITEAEMARRLDDG